MRTCPRCSKQFDDHMAFCPLDGSPLGADAPSTPGADGLIGHVLDGKYRIDEKIGQGGMGAVFRAWHVHMHVNVAVKMLRKDFATDQGTVERFRREALSAARIRHPNAVIVTDFGVSDVGLYLVMEYLEGHDLRRLLRARGRLTADETVSIIVQVCAAIDRAHHIGLIHRDLKPDNIWLVKDEETGGEFVKVLDFGIAKLRSKSSNLAALTEQGTVVGTPAYMSPEQCLGQELDPRSDIYSLGCVLFEMLTGTIPFTGDSPVAIGMKHNAELPKPPRTLNPTISEPLERVVLKALAKAPSDRQASAGQLADELLEAVAGSASTSPIGSASAGRERASGEHSRARWALPPTSSLGSNATVIESGALGDSAADTRLLASDSGPRPTATLAARTGSSRARRPLLWAALAAVVLLVPLAFAALRGVFAPHPVEERAKQEETAPPPPDVPGMILIPGGTFRMGTDLPDAAAESSPSHEATVAPFYLDAFEVTNAQYADFIRSTGRTAPPDWKGGQVPPGAERLPVTSVSWYDATEYARWANKRLPTETEWEFAASGNGRYPWGDEWSRQFANSAEDGASRPAAVGSYPRGASRFGVMDLASNVAEWVADEYAPYNGSRAKPNPGNRSFRGGTFRAPIADLILWERFYAKPDARFDILGFRCAKDAR